MSDRSVRERVTDTITFHPGNRTGTPEARRPACQMIADAAISTIRQHIQDILDTEDPCDDTPGLERVVEILEMP